VCANVLLLLLYGYKVYGHKVFANLLLISVGVRWGCGVGLGVGVRVWVWVQVWGGMKMCLCAFVHVFACVCQPIERLLHSTRSALSPFKGCFIVQ